MDRQQVHHDQVRHDLIDIMQMAHSRGWTLGTGGNFSTVLQREPLQLLMAPSGVDKGSVEAADLIVVDPQGTVLKGNGKASAETALHLTLAQYAGAGGVLHTHSPYATVLSLHFAAQGCVSWQGYEMQKGIAGITTHDTQLDLPVLPNTQDMTALGQKIRVPCADWPYGILLAGHGLYAWGNTLFEAKRHLEIYEFLLQVKYFEIK
ncbi:methylthioribulose 1-phosphate dehydratase [Leptolyngbya cf. ectocarpi LEGE 11479]|uniref:Methylthioribulose-1-phosphate dehydratase n=1 Tax=Leptolyngbya cf. ectocarpi LEGE 11479 TaxID=1828722 RepID=A0A928X2U6_LEPEC|nr:methylthioribulose 1-phosphate dehydratase [Leptolyngbya ectocarpi]MBE9066756.1 methylthioribulose 1-phosphate dehydratase [Leptolyngbya cf. ectocarpi LEGE 11479]